MRKITLILSHHHEIGCCNADGLVRIFRTLNPEVIFSEARAADHRNLEIKAVERYREFREPKLVSVDRYEVPVQSLLKFKDHLDRVFDYVKRASFEYQKLDEENDKRVHQHGFKYLNSDACTAMLARMTEIEEKVIAESDDNNLIQTLEWWQDSNQRREVEMAGSIYKYCRENDFAVGVFLVGAAHKAGIAREIEKYSGTDAGLINWDIAYVGQTHAT